MGTGSELLLAKCTGNCTTSLLCAHDLVPLQRLPNLVDPCKQLLVSKVVAIYIEDLAINLQAATLSVPDTPSWQAAAAVHMLKHSPPRMWPVAVGCLGSSFGQTVKIACLHIGCFRMTTSMHCEAKSTGRHFAPDGLSKDGQGRHFHRAGLLVMRQPVHVGAREPMQQTCGMSACSALATAAAALVRVGAQDRATSTGLSWEHRTPVLNTPKEHSVKAMEALAVRELASGPKKTSTGAPATVAAQLNRLSVCQAQPEHQPHCCKNHC